MQFLKLNEGWTKNEHLIDHMLSYSYKQSSPFILIVYWQQLLKSVAFQCRKAAKKNISEKLFFAYEYKG